MTEDRYGAGRRNDSIMRRIKNAEQGNNYIKAQTSDCKLKVSLIYSFDTIKYMSQKWVKIGISTNMKAEPFSLNKNIPIFILEQHPALKYL